MIRDPVDCFTQTRRKTPSPQPSPSKLALASLPLEYPASASGCGWEREKAAALSLVEAEVLGSLLPVRTRLRVRQQKMQARLGVLARRRTG